ncbi:hypothetical protein H2203_003205 [Taxawa tesnikishii (nom. ined.)]|nr:hypothetical protein H2203_003205 [Dothideales sp. JES 119]
MAKDYTDYLAVNVLNEGQIVSYRSLSRALKVHSNLAKQMLYDFHRKQNAKKPGTLHATYLITGRKQQTRESQANGTQSQDGEDTLMRSSPFPNSAPEPDQPDTESIWIRTVTLVKEEDLETAKAQLDELDSIHVYSLEPGPIKDMQVLTDCNAKIAVDYASEDPLEVWKQYGTIQNANVKRRTMRRPPPAPVPTTGMVKAKPTAPSIEKAQKIEMSKGTVKDAHTKDAHSAAIGSTKPTPDPEPTSASSSRKSSVSKPATVRRESSNIFKSFAKAKPKPVKEPSGKTKKQREEELRKMMDEEDEPMDDALGTAIDAPQKEEEPEQPKEEPAETVTVSNGRRRGRRRVMKKKTVRDEEGYLVTKEEPAWESFSEEEPAPKKLKPAVAAPAAKGKKGAGAKTGQGNIMSFFPRSSVGGEVDCVWLLLRSLYTRHTCEHLTILP